MNTKAPKRIYADADETTICGSYDIEEYDGSWSYILEAEVAKLVADAEARGMERALETMKTAGDSVVTEAMGQRLCCNGQDCGCHGATVEQYLEHLIRAEAAAIRRAAEETGA